METVKSADGAVIAYECAGHGPALIASVGAFCARQASVAPGDLTQRFTVVTYDRHGRVTAATPSRSRQKEPPFRPPAVSEQAGPHHGEPEEA